MIRKNIEWVFNLLISHSVVDKNSFISLVVGVLQIFLSLDIKVFSIFDLVKVRNSWNFKMIIECFWSILDKILRVVIQVTQEHDNKDKKLCFLTPLFLRYPVLKDIDQNHFSDTCTTKSTILGIFVSIAHWGY